MSLTLFHVSVMNSTISYMISPWTSICSFSVGPCKRTKQVTRSVLHPLAQQIKDRSHELGQTIIIIKYQDHAKQSNSYKLQTVFPCNRSDTNSQQVTSMIVVLTFTTDAPLANFLPNFLEASLNLIPAIQMITALEVMYHIQQLLE